MNQEGTREKKSKMMSATCNIRGWMLWLEKGIIYNCVSLIDFMFTAGVMKDKT